MSAQPRRAVWSWALYDWANSAFATTVMAGFFPIFLKEFWGHGLSPAKTTMLLGVTSSLASLAIALTAPLMGSMADQGFGKKIFLAAFTLLGVLPTAYLFWLRPGDWQLAAIAFGVASFGFFAALTFYDALLIDVSEPKNFNRISGLGYGLGYLGGGLLFLMNVMMFLKPQIFGLSSGIDGVRWSFLTVAVWWALFSVPLFVFVHEKKPARRPVSEVVRRGWQDLRRTTGEVFRQPTLLFFLGGFLLYNDGVNTIIKMAVDYGMALGLEANHLIQALLLVQFIGFPAAIAFGILGERIGAKRGILICLGVYVLVTLFATQISTSTHFYLLAGSIALVQGGIQALSRSYYAAMIPAERAGEFFGFFNLLGKFSAVLGPWLVGAATVASGSARVGIVVPLIFFLIGGFLLIKVKQEK